MSLLALFIFPIAYIFRGWVRRSKFFLLWWFLNSDEPTDIANDYGNPAYRERFGYRDDWNFIRKFILSYKWAGLRNNFYNFKLKYFRPRKGDIENLKIITNIPASGIPLKWRNREGIGKQYVKFTRSNQKQFRYSYTKKVNYIIWKGYRNVMIGQENRNIFKLRHWKTLI
jgi:hypothetical protein